MSLSGLLSKLGEKASGHLSPQPHHQQQQQQPQDQYYNNAPQPGYQSYNGYQNPYPQQYQPAGPPELALPQPQGVPRPPHQGQTGYQQPPPTNYYNQPPYHSPQYGPSPSHSPQPPQHHQQQQQQQQYAQPPPPPQQQPAKKSLALSYSSGGTSTIVKDPDSGDQIYIITYPKTDSWTGKSKSGLSQELHKGDKSGPIIGGWKISESTAKPSDMCLGDPKNGGQWQKLKTSSISTKASFSYNGRDFEWQKGSEKFALKLVEAGTDNEVAAFDPYTGMSSMTKTGTLNMQMLGGEDWMAAVLMTCSILVDKKTNDEIGKQVFMF